MEHQDTKLTSMRPRLKELNDNPYLLRSQYWRTQKAIKTGRTEHQDTKMTSMRARLKELNDNP